MNTLLGLVLLLAHVESVAKEMGVKRPEPETDTEKIAEP